MKIPSHDREGIDVYHMEYFGFVALTSVSLIGISPNGTVRL